MASTSTSVLVLPLFAIVVNTILLQHLPLASSNDFLAPLLSPIISNFCKDVGCGKGKCKVTDNTDVAYECECDPGWRQTLGSNTTSSALKFLPCVIPNCTLVNSCSDASPPAPSHESPMNASILEPCHWANCGGGVCNKTSPLTFSCKCNEGYYNLFSNAAFPCYKNCSIGGDCPNLGLPMSNPTSSAPNLPDTSTNKARSLQHEVFPWMIVLLASVALAL